MRILERLRAQPVVEIHLILTRSGEKTLHIEMGQTAADARKLAHFSYSVEDIGSRLASGNAVNRLEFILLSRQDKRASRLDRAIVLRRCRSR